jgi:AcrR family transcriptional regulator
LAFGHTVKVEAVCKVGEGWEFADGWSVPRQQDEAREVMPSHLEMASNNDIGFQPLISFEASPGLISGAAPLRLYQIVPCGSERWVFHEAWSGQESRLFIGVGALLIVLCLGWCGGSLYRYFDRRDELTDKAAISAVVEQIIEVESTGDPNAKNDHSAATGLGQFLSDTWLELIREYRPDLTKGRSESQTLALRKDAKLAREITARFVEHNAAVLRQRGLPVTAATIYLAHFAGAAGAVAVLSASDNASAALVMASADATGRTKPAQLIKANPFLEHFTVADLKMWADRKMQCCLSSSHRGERG